jgi:MFS family permease
MAGTGLGAFLLPPIVEFLIANHGWRTAYRGIGLGALLISLPIVFALFKEKPDSSTATDGEVMANKVETWGLTTKDAMRTKQFWILGAVLFLTVIVVAGLLSNFERIMTEQGFERSSIAQIAAVMGLTVIIGRLMVGALSRSLLGARCCRLLFPCGDPRIINFGRYSGDNGYCSAGCRYDRLGGRG